MPYTDPSLTKPVARKRDKENMPPSSRSFGLATSSSKRAHAAPASDDNDDYDDPDESYRRRKKAAAAAAAASSSSGTRLNGSYKAKRYADEQEYDDMRAVKKHSSSSSRPRREVEEGSDQEVEQGLWSDELLTERKAYDQWVEKKLSKLVSKREQMLEEKVDRVRSERDEVQSQYDELRRLRHTAPERALDDFKRTAETRSRHDKDLISSLKSKIEATEKRARESSGAPASAADRSVSILNTSVRDSHHLDSPDGRIEDLEKKHRRELAEATRAQRKLEEEVRSYKLQLEQEIAQSKALLAGATSQTGSSAAPASRNGKTEASSDSHARLSLPVSEHETAVRKLYEDLTGIVISSVEEVRSDAKNAPSKPYKRFRAMFAQEGYHSLVFDLEESQSAVQEDVGNSGKKRMRQDMVYVPRLDEDRDRDFLEDNGVPQAWKESIRFVKSSMFTWYEKTRKILRTDDARRPR